MEVLNERRGDGWGVVAYYKDAWEQTENHLLTAWKMLEPEQAEQLVWEYLKNRKMPLWIQVDSGELGYFSILTKRGVPESTYTTKKGITKTKKAYEETIHRTQHGEYLGTDSLLGSKPISYPIRIPVSHEYCRFTGLGDTLADCFQLEVHLLHDFDRSTITHKDVPRGERKNMRRVVRAKKAEPGEPKEEPKPIVKKPRFKIPIEKEEEEEEEEEEADDEDDE